MRKLLKNLLLSALMLMLLLPAIASADSLINPGEAFIIECLNTVPDVAVVCAVTPNNDPNGQLNKVGGYTAAVFFSSTLVSANAASMTPSSVINEGTSCGGCIEVYSSKADAEYRYDYLQSLKSLAGDSALVGTVVVRTSSKLSTSDSEQLKGAIVAALEEKAGSGVSAAETQAPEVPAVDGAALLDDYIFDNYYFPYALTAISVDGNIASQFDTISKPVQASVYPTQDGNGYHIYEYYVSDADNQVHISRFTFVSMLESDEVSGTIASLASTLGVLPASDASNFIAEANRFLQILELGQPYTRGDVTVNVAITEVSGSAFVCASFDGLNSL